MDNFSLPYRLHRNRNGGGVIIFVKEDIPSKFLTKHNFSSDVEGLFVELNFTKPKYLLCGTYRPPAQNDHFFNCIDLEKLLILTVDLQETLMQKITNLASVIFSIKRISITLLR